MEYTLKGKKYLEKIHSPLCYAIYLCLYIFGTVLLFLVAMFNGFEIKNNYSILNYMILNLPDIL